MSTSNITNIKITSLNTINNIANTTLLPVVNMTGAPNTE